MEKNKALLIIDVQLGMFENPLMPPVYGGEALLEKIDSLLSGARAAQIPVMYVQHNGGGGHPLQVGSVPCQIHPGIQPQEGEVVVQKTTPDSFQDTVLQQALEARNIQELIVAGIQTEYCVDTTCRRASSLGYDVTLIEDGHSTWDREPFTAVQIMTHHNRVLDDWFVTLKKANAVTWL